MSEIAEPAGWIWVGRRVALELSGWARTFQESGFLYRDRIRKGQPIFWWQTGPTGGIYGAGQVVGKPVGAGKTGWHQRECRFKVALEKELLTTPVPRVMLAKDPRLSSLATRLKQQRPNPRPLTNTEVTALRRLVRRVASDQENPEADEIADPRRKGAGFGDPVKNRKVEKAAVRFVRRHYERRGWLVRSVERENPGFDLICTTDGAVNHVEVKGTSGDVVAFPITGNELRAAREDPIFRLCVVLNALNRPALKLYSGPALLKRFELRPLSYLASLG